MHVYFTWNNLFQLWEGTIIVVLEIVAFVVLQEYSNLVLCCEISKFAQRFCQNNFLPPWTIKQSLITDQPLDCTLGKFF